MKKAAFALAASAMALLAAAQDRTIWKTVSPADGARCVMVKAGGKDLKYWALEGEGATVKVKGPTRLRIRSRAHFDARAGDSVAYELAITMDGKELETRKLTGRRSKSTTYAQDDAGSVPGAGKTHTIVVPEGEHTFRIKSNVRACGSFARATRKKRALRTEMTPAAFGKAVEEIYKERERTWYFSDKDKPIALEVTGPTTLDVHAALNFDASMRSTTAWRVEILVDGNPVFEKEFKSSRSHVRSYPDEKSLVPGQEENFAVPIPTGQHKIEIRPKGEHSLAVRIMIPTKDLKK